MQPCYKLIYLLLSDSDLLSLDYHVHYNVLPYYLLINITIYYLRLSDKQMFIQIFLE